MFKNFIVALNLLIILAACSSVKKAEKSIISGDYDTAFDIAVLELTKDKQKKSNQKLIPTLQEAYEKANERDKHKIKEFERLDDPSYLKKIYALYVAMDLRQDEILLLQPLYYNNKEVKFKTKNNQHHLEKALKHYSAYLLETGTEQLAGSKLDARNAFKTLNDLEFVNPNFIPNLSEMIRNAKLKGSSLVLIELINNVKQHTTQDHLDEFLRISESNMDNQWVVYNHKKDSKLSYDYVVKINLNQVQISSEQTNSELIQQQARVNDGWEYVYDRYGNVAKDSLGRDIKRNKIVTVQAEVKLFQQLKTSKVDGAISVTNLNTNTLMNNTPVHGEAKFENIYGQFRGDQRAIEQKYHQALQSKQSPFPPDDEFVKYALADFRVKMLQILNKQKF